MNERPRGGGSDEHRAGADECGLDDRLRKRNNGRHMHGECGQDDSETTLMIRAIGRRSANRNDASNATCATPRIAMAYMASSLRTVTKANCVAHHVQCSRSHLHEADNAIDREL